MTSDEMLNVAFLDVILSVVKLNVMLNVVLLSVVAPILFICQPKLEKVSQIGQMLAGPITSRLDML
jgi:hypothetical protein